MVEMLAFSRPEPTAMKTRPPKKAAEEGTASRKWPTMMIPPPRATVRRAPSSRSAIQPPGSASRYTMAL